MCTREALGKSRRKCAIASRSGTAVFCAQLWPHATDALAQAKAAFAALETAVIESGRIFAGDVREIYPWRQRAGIEMQIPII